MTQFKTGEFVTHATLDDWGVGKVLESLADGKCLIHFESAGKKIMQEGFLRPADAPASFAPRAEAKRGPKRVAKASPKTTSRAAVTTAKAAPATPHGSKEAILHDFLDLFPEGFSTPEYLHFERDPMIEASRFVRTYLSKDNLQGLLAGGEFDAVLQLAQRVLAKTRLIAPAEASSFTEGVKKASPGQKKELAEALYDIIYGEAPVQQRFDRLAGALAGIGAARWTLATFFPFLGDPTAFLPLKPEIARICAAVFGFPLQLGASPSWSAYSRFLEFGTLVAAYLRDEAKLTPTDMIDVQGFMWCADPGTHKLQERQDIMTHRVRRGTKNG